MAQKHWLIRVENGYNLRNSRFPFWGVKNGCKGFVKKMQPGNIIWFCTSKPFGGKLIAVAEYTGSYDVRDNNPTLPNHFISALEQGWTGEGPWPIQIHYKNMYITERQNIRGLFQVCANIMDYDNPSFKEKINGDLREYYEHYKFCGELKLFT